MRPTFYLIVLIIQSIHRSDAKQRKPQARKSCAPLKMEQKLLKAQLDNKTCKKLSEAAEKHRSKKGREGRKKLLKIGKDCQKLAKFGQKI